MAETYKSFGTILSTTGSTTLYTSTVTAALVNSVNFSNASATAAATVTLEMVKGATAFSLITGVAIPTATTFQALDAPVVLQNGNSLRATAGASGYIHVITSLMEIT
jgi:hypothetical protein